MTAQHKEKKKKKTGFAKPSLRKCSFRTSSRGSPSSPNTASGPSTSAAGASTPERQPSNTHEHPPKGEGTDSHRNKQSAHTHTYTHTSTHTYTHPLFAFVGLVWKTTMRMGAVFCPCGHGLLIRPLVLLERRRVRFRNNKHVWQEALPLKQCPRC